MRREFVRALGVTCLIVVGAATGGAQTLVGVGGPSGFAIEFDLGPGSTCSALPWSSAWPYAANPPSCSPAVPALGVLAAPPALLGDVAIDRSRNVVFVTDGYVIGEFTDSGGASGAVLPTSSFAVPPILTPSGVLGPLTGMGFDDGTSILWITDGTHVAGLGPFPLSTPCDTPSVVVSAFAHGLGAGVVLTDLTWDPRSWTFWACDTTGVIHNLLHGGGLAAGGTCVAGSCGTLSGPLMGIAFDLATPASLGPATGRSVPTAYVTDGFGAIEAIDLTTGAIAGPTFYDSSPCRTLSTPLNGLAYSGRPVEWGNGSFRSRGYGHATSPSSTLGVVADSTTPGGLLWLAYGSSASGLGTFCPAIPVFGASLYVNFVTPPGGLVFMGVAQPGSQVVPLSLGPGLPPGLQLYTQFFEDASGIGLGPVRASNPLVVTVLDS